MKFYNRTEELQTLERIAAQSTETACFTVMIGRNCHYCRNKTQSEENQFANTDNENYNSAKTVIKI